MSGSANESAQKPMAFKWVRMREGARAFNTPTGAVFDVFDPDSDDSNLVFVPGVRVIEAPTSGADAYGSMELING